MTVPPKPAAHTPGAHASGSKAKPKRKHGNRFAVLNSLVDVAMRGLTQAELKTWLVLYRDTKNGIAATGQTDIARRSGLSVRAVKGAIRKLTKRGLLVVVYRGGLNRGCSRYRVLGTGEPAFTSTGAKTCISLGNHASPFP